MSRQQPRNEARQEVVLRAKLHRRGISQAHIDPYATFREWPAPTWDIPLGQQSMPYGTRIRERSMGDQREWPAPVVCTGIGYPIRRADRAIWLLHVGCYKRLRDGERERKHTKPRRGHEPSQYATTQKLSCDPPPHFFLSLARSNDVAPSIRATRKKRDVAAKCSHRNALQHNTSSTPKKDKFCYLCQNGGHSVACARCPRVVCINHLAYQAAAIPKKTLATLAFICPSCHILQSRASRKSDPLVKLPYTAFYDENNPTHQPQPVRLQVPYQVAQHARLNTNWLWIVHLRLSSLREPGSVAKLVYEGLRGYFVDDEERYLVYHDIEFNLNTDADAEEHRNIIMRALGPLADIPDARIMIYVYTHSHDTTGVPFFGVNLAASDIHNWFDVLIPQEVRTWLQKHDTTLFMLCCGAIITSKTSYAELRAQCEKYYFFLTISGLSFNDVQFGNVLAQSQDLGRHSRVIVMSPRENATGTTVAEYFWMSPTIRPHGVNIPPQCPDCYALSCFKISCDSRNRTTTTRCVEPGCTYTYTYEPPQGNIKELPTVEGSWAKAVLEP
ncbi:hypothetical protein BV20DRAFT_978667 [Pilatotrama ljubarskyi]|nr:hypothetical protein BV20DRAFT_978667 [Pilatotrama ljubarskyi]